MTPLRRSAVSLVISYAGILVLSTVVVILRYFSIRILKRKVNLHDILCVVSLVSRGPMTAPDTEIG